MLDAVLVCALLSVFVLLLLLAEVTLFNLALLTTSPISDRYTDEGDEVVLNLSCKLGTFTLGFYGLEFIDEAVAATTGAAIPNSAKNSSMGSLRAFLFSSLIASPAALFCCGLLCQGCGWESF